MTQEINTNFAESEYEFLSRKLRRLLYKQKYEKHTPEHLIMLKKLIKKTQRELDKVTPEPKTLVKTKTKKRSK